MKNFYLSLALISLAFGAKAQPISVEVFDFSSYGDIENAFIDNNDHLVLSTNSGIYILDDTVELQKIDSSGVNAFKGRNGNIIFAYGDYGFRSWKNGILKTYQGDSSIMLRDAAQAIELYNGNILCLKKSIVTDLIMFDSVSSYELTTNQNYIYPFYDKNFIEIDSNLIFSRITHFGDQIYFEPSTGQLTIFNDSIFISPNSIRDITNGAAQTLNYSTVDAIINVQDSTINNITYYANFGVNFDANDGAEILFLDDKLALVNKDYFVIIDNSNITVYDSSDGYYSSTAGILSRNIFANSQNVIYAFKTDKVYKIFSPLMTSLGSEMLNKGIKIFPNPIQNELGFYSSQDVDLVQLQNMQGKLVLESELLIQAGYNSTPIKMDIPRGVYVATFFNKGIAIQRTKVIKQ